MSIDTESETNTAFANDGKKYRLIFLKVQIKGTLCTLQKLKKNSNFPRSAVGS